MYKHVITESAIMNTGKMTNSKNKFNKYNFNKDKQ